MCSFFAAVLSMYNFAFCKLLIYLLSPLCASVYFTNDTVGRLNVGFLACIFFLWKVQVLTICRFSVLLLHLETCTHAPFWCMHCKLGWLFNTLTCADIICEAKDMWTFSGVAGPYSKKHATFKEDGLLWPVHTRLALLPLMLSPLVLKYKKIEFFKRYTNKLPCCNI